ncbi:hypothetical protein BGX29_010271, partial [Mortierella sp. GBA35]
ELRQLALEKVQLGSVVEAGPRNPTILLPERFVVRLARHIHGGQVGVNNAQATRVQAQDLLPIPAADDEGHYRRNLLRAKFMERGVFPAEDLRFVEQYIYVVLRRSMPTPSAPARQSAYSPPLLALSLVSPTSQP